MAREEGGNLPSARTGLSGLKALVHSDPVRKAKRSICGKKGLGMLRLAQGSLKGLWEVLL